MTNQTYLALLARFARDESGATAIEYALIVAIISMSIIPFLDTYAVELTDFFTRAATALLSV